MALKDVLIRALGSSSSGKGEKGVNFPVTEMREWDDYVSLTKSDNYLEQFFGWSYRAGKTIADSVVSYPLKLYEGDEDTPKEVKKKGNQLLKDLYRFNGYQDGGEARWITRIHLDFAGIAYWVMFPSEDKEYKYEFFILHPNRVSVKTNSMGIPDYYIFRDTTGGEHKIKTEQIIVFKEPDPDNWLKGRGSLSGARLPHNIWEQMQEFNMNFFGNKATPEGLLAFEGISEENRSKMEKLLKQKYGGTKNAGKIGILNLIPTWIPLTNTQKDLQYTEGINAMRDEILSIFGVPKPLVGLTDSTYTNSIEAQRIFQRYTLKPKLDREVNILNNQLIRNYYAKDRLSKNKYYFIATDPVEADEKADSEVVSVLYREGIITKNEAREKVGFETIEDGEEFKETNYPTLLPTRSDSDKDDEKNIKSVKSDSERFKREELRDYFYTKMVSQEETFTNVASRFFTAQAKRLIKQLNVEDKKINYNPVIDWSAENATTVDVFWGVFEDLMKSAWTDANDLTGYNQALSDDIRQIIQNRINYFADEINDTTAKELSKILERAVSEGNNSSTVAKEIKDLFDKWANGGEGIAQSRAMTIASTETATVTNSIMMENYKRSDNVEKKEWLSSRDRAVRGSNAGDKYDHLSADGQVVDKNGYFTVSGEQLDRPGDPSGSAGNIINCRCVALPVLKSF